MPARKESRTVKKSAVESIVGIKGLPGKISFPSLFKKMPSKNFFLIIIFAALAALLIYKKNWLIAVTVNGQPITNFELLARMNSQYRDQTLTQMINEKIIFDEAKKRGIVVSNSEIDGKIAEIEQNLGGKDVLDSMLAQQKQTRDSLIDQVKIQLIIEKMFDKDASVSADEIKQFLAENKDRYTATDSAEQTKSITEMLKQQKLAKIFNEKFQQLKQDAKIKIF